MSRYFLFEYFLGAVGGTVMNLVFVGIVLIIYLFGLKKGVCFLFVDEKGK